MDRSTFGRALQHEENPMRQSTRLLARPLTAVLATAAWLVAVPTANATANAQAQMEAPGSSDKAVNITEQKLDAAAAAIEQMANVKEEYKQRIEAAPPAEQERIADEGNSALVKAVTDQGLSVEEYSTILLVAQNDPNVREKIVQRIKSKDKPPAPER
jgi:hypothetical protein